MALPLIDIHSETSKAIGEFWKTRQSAIEKQVASGVSDQGERGAVTGGKNMDGFVSLVRQMVVQSGLKESEVLTNTQLVTLPGYFRPTKKWDLLVISRGLLVAAFEFKSQVGPSFGNNFNNRCEESLGSAVDVWTAFREGAFGSSPKPFLGYLLLVESCPASSRRINISNLAFPVLDEFQGTSYIDRYGLLCKKLVQEKLYDAAALLTSTR